MTLPAVEILDISIDDDSIQYYDEKAALLNWERKEDALDAIASAKEDVEQQTQEMEDLETMAREQAKTLITGMLSETIGDKTLVIKFEKEYIKRIPALLKMCVRKVHKSSGRVFCKKGGPVFLMAEIPAL